MKSVLKQIVILIISLFFLWIISFKSYMDLSFFLTKKNAIVSNFLIKENVINNSYDISLEYYNVYLQKVIKCNPKLSNHNVEKFAKEHKSEGAFEISYSYRFPHNIYIKGINEPRFFVLFIDLFLFLLTVLGCYLFGKTVFKKSI